MSVQALLIAQMVSKKRVWSIRWDIKRDSTWETDLLSTTTPLWPEHWKEGEHCVAFTKSGGFAVYTAVDDVVVYALGDEELGELALQHYLEHVTSILSALRKRDMHLSRSIVEEYPRFSTVLFDTVSPGGRIGYTALPDE